MKSIKLATLILLNILSLQLCSCVRNTSPSDDIYSDSYINSSLQQYKPLNSEAGMTERDAVNTALSNNPEYKINELKAKAAAIEAEKKYKTNSYALAANMGITSAELPANIGTQKSILLKSMNNDKKSWRNLNYYLNVAIKNRLDLKAHKAALRAAKYDLYSAAGELTPRVNATVKNSNASVSASERLSPGRNLAGMRIKGADYAMQQENLHKKWISIVKEVKEAYLKLTMQLAIRKILESTMQMAKQRRDMAAKQYNAGKTKSIAILSQAQQDLVNAQKSFIKAEKELHDARAELYAACGIQNDKTKKPKHYNIESGTR